MISLVNRMLFLFLVGLVLAPTPTLAAEQAIAKDTRCAVCGMFVAKYPNWLATLTMSDGATLHFDGVKDMMVFFFNPGKYGAKPGATVSEMKVNDYYSLSPLDARKAFYVVGSDVTGPMGHEFVPFAAKEAAEAFSKDHQGKKVITFTEITAALVEEMRSGQRMQ
jgi:nitrous oxide reductase accessory protein NosL